MTFAAVVAIAGAASAQGGGGFGGGRRGGGQFSMATFLGPMIAVAADKDSSGDVSAEEWKGFFKDLATDKEGMVDTSALSQSIYVKLMDRDGDAKLEKSDLEKVHKELDTNSDGILQREEAFSRGNSRNRGGRGDRGGRRGGGDGGDGGGGFLSQDDEPKKEEKKKETFATRYQQQALSGMTRLADKDSNREITVDEWKEFMGGLKTEGDVLTSEQVTTLMKGPQREAREGDEGGEGEGRRGRRRGGFNRGFDSMLNRALEDSTKADVEAMFDELDKNDDKALQAEELQRQRRRREPV